LRRNVPRQRSSAGTHVPQRQPDGWRDSATRNRSSGADQMIVQRSLSLEDAQLAIGAAIDYAREKNWRIAVVVVDRTGELISCARMDGRSPRFLKAAHRKAYTAAVFEMDTSGVMKFWKRQEDAGHRGPHDWNDPMFTTLP